MIKLTVDQALASLQPRPGQEEAPLARLVNEPLPAATAWQVLDLVDALNKVAQRFNEIQSQALERHNAQPVEGRPGAFHFLDSDDQRAYQAELQAYLDLPLEYDLQPLKRAMIHHARIPAGDLATMGWLFENGGGLPDPLADLEEEE